MRFVTTIFAAVSLLALPALGDVEPDVVDREDAGCTKYLFCDAQTATGDCTVEPAAGDEIVLRVFRPPGGIGGKSQLTFYSIQSVGVHECNIMSNDEGHDAASGVGFQINAVSLTDTAPIDSFSGLFDYIWVTCPTIGTSATVTALVCTANR